MVSIPTGKFIYNCVKRTFEKLLFPGFLVGRNVTRIKILLTQYLERVREVHRDFVEAFEKSFNIQKNEI